MSDVRNGEERRRCQFQGEDKTLAESLDTSMSTGDTPEVPGGADVQG